MSQQLIKAKLFSLDAPEYDIEFMFNPTLLDFTRSIKLNQPQGARSRSGQPKVSFAAPEPCTISLSKITFDTYERGTSVLPYINQLLKAVRFIGQPDRSTSISLPRQQTSTPRRGAPQTNQRPPIFLLIWGSNDYLRCFVESCKYQLTMFLPDGTPVRAVVTLTLKEVDESAIQGNPRLPNQQDRFGDSRDRREEQARQSPLIAPLTPRNALTNGRNGRSSSQPNQPLQRPQQDF